jgi:hypothetical protein
MDSTRDLHMLNRVILVDLAILTYSYVSHVHINEMFNTQ